jgi:glycosyltransferase involved in cell wall biosynthesis
MSGGQTRSYNLIKNLSKKHEITLFSLIKDDNEKKYISELQKYCKKVSVFKRPKTPWTFRNIFLTGFGPYPFLVIRNLVPEERDAVKEEMSKEKYDLIHAETFYVMPHIPKTNVPVLLVDQTIEYLVYKHFVEDQSPLLLRPILWIDILKIRFWETFYWKQSKMVVAMSDSDAEAMKDLMPKLDVRIVPNGVDIDYFSAPRREVGEIAKILYVGFFSWLQNAEAAEALILRVWPDIKSEVSKSKLWIVGKNITDRIKSFASAEVEVTESIPDIRDAYRTSSVLVAPIKGPGGTRLKILEAMASSLPVVTTPIGAEGLGLDDGKEALIRASERQLAKAAVSILKNKNLAEKLGRAGKKFVETNYSWEKSAELLDKLYKEVVLIK